VLTTPDIPAGDPVIGISQLFGEQKWQDRCVSMAHTFSGPDYEMHILRKKTHVFVRPHIWKVDNNHFRDDGLLEMIPRLVQAQRDRTIEEIIPKELNNECIILIRQIVVKRSEDA
jgi:hypothetical protein